MEKSVIEFLKKNSETEQIIFQNGVTGINYNPEYHENLRNGFPELTTAKMKKGINRLGKYLKFSMA